MRSTLCPAWVGVTGLVRRSRTLPASCSMTLMRCDIAEGLTLKASAAASKVPYSMTAAKVVRWSVVKRFISISYVNPHNLDSLTSVACFTPQLYVFPARVPSQIPGGNLTCMPVLRSVCTTSCTRPSLNGFSLIVYKGFERMHTCEGTTLSTVHGTQTIGRLEGRVIP